MRRKNTKRKDLVTEVKTEAEEELPLQSSVSHDEVVETIEEEFSPVKLEPEIKNEFDAVLNGIKCEEPNLAGQFETVYLNPVILSQNNEATPSEQSVEFSKAKTVRLRCRLCAARGNHMIFIFGRNKTYKNIVEKIEHCLPIMVRETDTLPKQACRNCLEKLESCYQFRKTVEDAEKRLLMYNEEIPANLEEIDERCRISSSSNGHCAAKKHADNDKRSETSFWVDEKGNESITILEGVQKVVRTVENNINSSNLNSHSEALSSIANRDTRLESLIDLQKELQSEREVLDSENCGREVNEGHGGEDISDDQIVSCKIVDCRICGEEFRSVQRLDIHAGLHASTSYYPCRICDETFTTETEWEKHALEHSVAVESRITTASQSDNKSDDKFVTRLKLKFQKLYHKSSTQPHHCDKCNKDMDSEASLHQHLINVHRDDKESDHDESQEQPGTQEQIIINKKEDDRALQCTLCGVRFRSDVLQTHRKTCSPGTNLSHQRNSCSCHYCGKEFIRKEQLAIHIRTHTGERPYSCGYCAHKFVEKRKRDYHQKKHKGERLFRCFTCKKTFTTLRALGGHRRSHLHSENNRCSVCNRKFTTTSKRNAHMSVHTGGNTCQCDVCGTYLKWERSLWRHKRTQHGIIRPKK